MRIGVDATSWFNRRGYGRFTRELLPEMVAAGREHEFVLFAGAAQAATLDLGAPNARVRAVDCGESPTDAASSDGYRSPRDMLRFTSAARAERLDAFFFPTVYTYFPLCPARGAVVTIHDTIAERFPELTLPTRRARLFWRMKVGLALRQARIVLTVSDYSAKDIAARLRVPASRLRVTSEAPSPAYRVDSSADDVRASVRTLGLPEGARWFTYVGGFNPHKRIDVLLKAHARLAAANPDAPHLLLVGTIDADVFHGCRAELVALIDRLATKGLVHWTGFVPDESLRALHAGAIACVLPSESEGFGLPAVESAAAGAAVIATLESPLPALLEGGGWFVRPGDEEALAGAMRSAAEDEPDRRAKALAGRERARALNWRSAAEKALAAVVEAAA